MDVLDYEDDMQDPEITETIANIPPRPEDVEMWEADPPLGFEPEFSHTGYDHNLVRASEDMGPGSTSPVTAREDRMLEEGPQLRAPRTGRLGPDENSGCLITKKESITLWT